MASCNRKSEDTLDDAALEAVGVQATAQLNEPGAAMIGLIKSLDKPTPIGPESLMLVLDQKSTQVDWWFYGHNLIELIEPVQDPNRPTFLTAPVVRTTPSSDWFEAGAGTPENVDCQSASALQAQGCEADVTLTLSLTPAGQTMLGAIPLQPVKLHVLVAHAGEAWEVKSLQGEGGLSVHDLALNILLGPEPQRAVQRQAMLDNLSSRSQLGATTPNPDAFSVGGDATLVPLDTSPVAPVVGDNPLAPPPRGRPAPRSVP